MPQKVRDDGGGKVVQSGFSFNWGINMAIWDGKERRVHARIRRKLRAR